jgi:DNA-directed RNA polymerase specialized sigma24 family protein
MRTTWIGYRYAHWTKITLKASDHPPARVMIDAAESIKVGGSGPRLWNTLPWQLATNVRNVGRSEFSLSEKYCTEDKINVDLFNVLPVDSRIRRRMGLRFIVKQRIFRHDFAVASIPLNDIESMFPGNVDFAKTLYDSHIHLVERWVRQLLTNEAFNAIDGELLASIVVEELILSVAKHTNLKGMSADENMRFCRQIAKHQCINAAKHLHRKKRDGQRVFQELGALADRKRTVSTDPAKVAEAEDFVQALLSSLPEEHHQVVCQLLMGFSKTEIAIRIGVSRNVLRRMYNEIGDVANRLLTQKAPNSQLPTPNSQLPTPNSQLPAPSSKLQTPNSKLQTPNSKLQTRGKNSSSAGSRNST